MRVEYEEPLPSHPLQLSCCCFCCCPLACGHRPLDTQHNSSPLLIPFSSIPLIPPPDWLVIHFSCPFKFLPIPTNEEGLEGVSPPPPFSNQPQFPPNHQSVE